MTKYLLVFLSLTLFNIVMAKEQTVPSPKANKNTSSAIITHKIKGSYFEVDQNIRSAIIGKGIHIAHILPASSMLQRTGPAYGYKKSIYANAEILEFCSAELSQKLSRIHPDNIVMCPFTISVYTLNSEPDTVRLSYQVPQGKPGTEEVVEEIKSLIEGIIEDASW